MLRRRAVLAITALTAGLAVGVAEAGADIDNGFGGGGRYVVSSTDRLYPVIRPDGSVLAVGVEFATNAPVVDGRAIKSVLRVDQLDSRGVLTPGFGTDGTVRIDLQALPGFDELVEPAGAILLADGRLVVQSPSSVGNHLVRLTADGALDASFGGDGLVADQFQPCGLVTDLAHDPNDGSLYSVARKPDPGSVCPGTTVRKYTASGGRVEPWGNAGYDGTAHETHLFAGSVAVDDEGSVLVAGVSEHNDVNTVAVLRLNSAGMSDPTFAGDGLLEFDPAPVAFEKYLEDGFPPELMENKYATDLALDDQGRILLTGASGQAATPGNADVWVARLTSSGALDEGFDGDGMAWRDLGGDDYGLSVVADADGGAIVTGASRASTDGTGLRRQFTTRFRADGSRDETVGDNITQYHADKDTVGHDQALTPSGDVIVGGLYFDQEETWKAGRGYLGAVDLDGSSPPTTSSTTPSIPTTPSTVPTTTSTTQPPAETVPDFTAIPPTRVLDTRWAESPQPIVAGVDRTVPLAHVVPEGAVAAAVNVTVTNPTAHAFASVYPAGATWPGTSVVNYLPGQTIANSVVVKLGTDRSLKVHVGAGTAEVVIDVQGWYSAPGFSAVEPFRQFDSRTNGGQLGTEPVPVRFEAPAGATAVALNLTATGSDTSGYLIAWPGGEEEPYTSLVNFAAGEGIANGVIVKLGSDGTVDLRNAAGHTHAVVDVMGWVMGDDYQAVLPERVVDTRRGLGGGALGEGEPRDFDLAPAGVDPVDIGAVAVNVTITEGSTGTFLSAWPAGGTPSHTSVVNAVAGQTIANGLVLGVTGGKLCIYNNLGDAHVIVDVLGWYPAA